MIPQDFFLSSSVSADNGIKVFFFFCTLVMPFCSTAIMPRHALTANTCPLFHFSQCHLLPLHISLLFQALDNQKLSLYISHCMLLRHILNFSSLKLDAKSQERAGRRMTADGMKHWALVVERGSALRGIKIAGFPFIHRAPESPTSIGLRGLPY